MYKYEWKMENKFKNIFINQSYNNNSYINNRDNMKLIENKKNNTNNEYLNNILTYPPGLHPHPPNPPKNLVYQSYFNKNNTINNPTENYQAICISKTYGSEESYSSDSMSHERTELNSYTDTVPIPIIKPNTVHFKEVENKSEVMVKHSPSDSEEDFISDLKKKNFKYKKAKSPLSKSPNGKFTDYRKKQNIYCVNCGEKGHIVKECFAPITSYGIISFKINKNEDDDKYDKNEKLNSILRSEFICDKKEEYPKIKFLMIQRKDTIGYIDFIR